MLYLKGLKKSHKISRLLQIAIALTLLVGLIQLWQTSLLQGQQLLKSQTQKMARLLVQQTAYGATPALQLQNDEQLQWLTSALVLDPKVMSATIYSEQGLRLSFAQSVTTDELEPDSEEMLALLAPYPPYVEAVTKDGLNLGFVEVRLDPKLFFNEIKEIHQLNMEQQQMMLLVAGLIGMLLSRALSFKRADFDRRRTRVKSRKQAQKKLEKQQAKAAKASSASKTQSLNSANDTALADLAEAQIGDGQINKAPSDKDTAVNDSAAIDESIAPDTGTDIDKTSSAEAKSSSVSSATTDNASTEVSLTAAPKTRNEASSASNASPNNHESKAEGNTKASQNGAADQSAARPQDSAKS